MSPLARPHGPAAPPGSEPLAAPPHPPAAAASGPPVEMLSRILRGLGAAVLVASASVFLLQRWQGGDDVERYLMLLALTGLLSAAGFFCGLALRESKGARTLLALVLAVIPVHFGVLGGLLYSQLALDGGPPDIPAYATWVAPSAWAAVGTTAGAMVVLVPLVLVSFLALVRGRAAPLTGLYLGMNALMLVPVRTPDFVAVIVGGLVSLLAWLELRSHPRHAALRTFEGRLVRVMLAVPVALMVARTVQYYEVTSFFLGVLSAALGGVMFAFAPTVLSDREQQAGVQGASTVPVAVGWFFLARSVLQLELLPDAAAMPLVALPVSLLLVLMSLATVGEGATYRRVAAVLAMGSMGVNLLLHPGVLSAFVCLTVAVATLAYGYVVEQRMIFASGLAGAVFGLVHHVRYAIEHYALSNWGSLAVLGVAIIVGASYLERNHAQLRAAAQRVRERFRPVET